VLKHGLIVPPRIRKNSNNSKQMFEDHKSLLALFHQCSARRDKYASDRRFWR
jgi:hypothetical protein